MKANPRRKLIDLSGRRKDRGVCGQYQSCDTLNSESVMGSYGGRVQCILLSTLNGYVIYESFYDQFNDIQKAEIRTSFDDALGSHDIEHGLDVVGRFKCVFCLFYSQTDSVVL